MEFGIFSNGFRPHSSAAESYNEDIREIVLADELGFRDAYISEHHGEKPYIGRVDTIPTPEMMMCKAAGLTKRIRMGSAVKLIHLHHPVDVAIQAAVTDHMLGTRPLYLRLRHRFRVTAFLAGTRPQLRRPPCASGGIARRRAEMLAQ